MRLHISQGSTTHVLEASLTTEGSRNYKIDGRIKTGTQVKVNPLLLSTLSCQLLTFCDRKPVPTTPCSRTPVGETWAMPGMLIRASVQALAQSSPGMHGAAVSAKETMFPAQQLL